MATQATERTERAIGAEERLRWALVLAEVGLRIHDRLNALVAGVGITMNQYVVLLLVEQDQGRATVSTLAERLGRAVHTLTAAVNGLEKKGLVLRQTIRGEDRRIIRIATTREGRFALDHVGIPEWAQVAPTLLTDQEMAKLLAGERPWQTPPLRHAFSLEGEPDINYLSLGRV